MILIIRFSDLSTGIFNSMLWVTKAVFIDNRAILNIWVIGMTDLAIAGDIVVSRIAKYKTVIYRAVESKVALSEAVVYRIVILEVVVYESKMAVSSESCLSTANEVVADT